MKSFVLCMLCLPMVFQIPDEGRRPDTRNTRDIHKSIFPWEPSASEQSQQKRPEFKDTERMVSVSPGDTAVLRCQVQNLGSKTVTWRRYGSIHPLTIGSITFVSNSRVHAERRRLFLTTTTRATKLHTKTTTTTTTTKTTMTSKTPSVPTRRVHQPTPKFHWSANQETTTTTTSPVYRPFQPVLIPARGHKDDYDEEEDEDYANFAYAVRRPDVFGANLERSLSGEAAELGMKRSATGRYRRRLNGANESSIAVDEWSLFISDVRPSDQDIYQCQVNSKDDQYKFYDIFLKVKNIHVHGTQKVEQGTEIQLTCNVTLAFQEQPQQQQHSQQPQQPQLVQTPFSVQQKNFTSPLPNFLAWFKDGQLVISDLRKGISVSREISEKSSASVLTVKRAQLADGGIYVCREGTDWQSRWNNVKKADNLVAHEPLQHSSVLDSSAHRHDSLMSQAFQPDSASIYVHIISSSPEKRGTLAEKVTSDSFVNRLSVIDVSTAFFVYIYIIMKLG